MDVEKYKWVEKTITNLIKYWFSSGLDNPHSELSYLQETKENHLSTHPSSLLRQVKTMTGAEDDSWGKLPSLSWSSPWSQLLFGVTLFLSSLSPLWSDSLLEFTLSSLEWLSSWSLRSTTTKFLSLLCSDFYGYYSGFLSLPLFMGANHSFQIV